MKVINLYNLSLQFDADQITQGTDEEQAARALEIVNNLLKRESWGLSAQLMSNSNNVETSSYTLDEASPVACLKT